MFQTTEPWDILPILQGEMDRFTIFVGDTDTALIIFNETFKTQFFKENQNKRVTSLTQS